MGQVHRNLISKTKKYRDERENKYQWVIAGAPSEAWAKKVFPHLSKKQAVKELWDKIVTAMRREDK